MTVPRHPDDLPPDDTGDAALAEHPTDGLWRTMFLDAFHERTPDAYKFRDGSLRHLFDFRTDEEYEADQAKGSES